MTATSQQRPRSKSFGDRVRELRERARQEAGLDYQLLRFIIFFLVGIGVLMVFSSSMATSLTEDGGVWNQALRQCVMVFLGLVAFWFGLKVSPHTLRKCVPWIVGLSIILLIAVLIPGVGTGREEVGSQSWIYLGPFSLQPSELARIAVGMFGATVLADKEHKSMKVTDPFMMYSLIAGVMFLLIVLQGDFGMALSLALVVVFTLIFAGVDWRVPATITGEGQARGNSGLFLASTGGASLTPIRSYSEMTSKGATVRCRSVTGRMTTTVGHTPDSGQKSTGCSSTPSRASPARIVRQCPPGPRRSVHRPKEATGTSASSASASAG